MPRFLVEMAAIPLGTVELDVLAGRFPEVEVERTYLTQGGDGERMIGVCSAPSEAHVRRWLSASHIHSATVRRVVSGDRWAVSDHSFRQD